MINPDFRKKMADSWFSYLQSQICKEFQFLEKGTKKFVRRDWNKKNKNEGGGTSFLLSNGNVFEKVGVNKSTVSGKFLKKFRPKVLGASKDGKYWASGVSVVAHMKNPLTPAIHLNTRMFWTPHAWWFGGGTDLNPSIVNEEDTKFFHDVLKKNCDKHNKEYYSKFKKWADTYFFIPHRKVARGVGGIFFDDLNTGNWENDFFFTKDVGNALIEAYIPITKKHFLKSWSIDQKNIQEIKRGLYAEFNLVHDRGTKFGLQSGHNVEAVLMSLPPTAQWI